MEAILPAVIGGAVLILGLIYWRVIMPKLAEKKKKKADEAEAKIRDAERRACKDFVVSRILPKIPYSGSIAFPDLLSLLQMEETAGGGVLDMALLKDSLKFGLDKTSGYLIMKGGEWALGRKGSELRAKKT